MNRIRNLLCLWTGRPEPDEPTEDDLLREDIREVCDRLTIVRSRFDDASDGDLVDACIYELESLHARYRFLIRQARERGLTCTPMRAGLLRVGGEA